MWRSLSLAKEMPQLVELTELVVVGSEEPRGPVVWYGQMVAVVV